MTTLSWAGSHVGRIRANNQDSGYAGSHLFVVADGMGGHAGGDVASALAIQSIAHIDREFDSPEEAEEALASALLEANKELAETVFEHPELTGMGTTVSGFVRVGDQLALAHIGDSRIYRWRDHELTQITKDHTFVQRLVDSGRITEEEAATHPRRSVLMRVLGDVDITPEIDTMVVDTQPGDRWLLCSDGLTGYVPESEIASVLSRQPDAAEAGQQLIEATLENGAPDNVTIVIVDVGGPHPVVTGTPTIVGSASTPLDVDVPSSARPGWTGWLHPNRQAANEPTHFEPDAEFLEELIEEDRRRARRRRIGWIVGAVVVIALMIGGLVLAYNWTQTRFFVGADETSVVIYRGVQQDIGPIALSSEYEQTGIDLADLPEFTRQTVETTISAGSLTEAREIVDRLRRQAEAAG